MGVLDTLRGATPARAIVRVILNGALQAEYDATIARLKTASARDANRSLEDVPTATEVAAELDEISDRIAASEVVFHLQAPQWQDRLALQAAHPPRADQVIDQLRGHNIETYTPAIIRASVVKIVGADGDEVTDVPDDVWNSLLGRPAVLDDDGAVVEPMIAGSLNYMAVAELANAAADLTDKPTSVPPSARSLLESQDSGASSKQPSPGTSALDGSVGGSRPTSRRSSATKKATSSRGRSTGS